VTFQLDRFANLVAAFATDLANYPPAVDMLELEH
jgi:hypothetical protein